MEMFLEPKRKVFALDYSTLAVGCDRKLYWSRHQSLRRKVEKTSTFFGKALHKFVEHFWLGSDYPTCIKAFDEYARRDGSPIDLDPESEDQRSYKRGIEICTAYFVKYEPERVRIKVARVNGEPLMEQAFAFPLGTDSDGYIYIYTGRLDRVELREGNEYWLVDTKSTTRFGPTYWKNLRPNDQITGYSAGMLETLGIKAKFYALDVIAFGTPRTSVPKALKGAPQSEIDAYQRNVRLEQGPTSRSEEDIRDWWTNTLTEAIRIRKLWTGDAVNIYTWTRRTSQCSAYGGCDFADLCAVTANHAPIIDTLYEVKPWSPFHQDEEKEVSDA